MSVAEWLYADIGPQILSTCDSRWKFKAQDVPSILGLYFLITTFGLLPLALQLSITVRGYYYHNSNMSTIKVILL